MAKQDQPSDEFRTVLASVDRQGRRRWLYVDLGWGFWRRCRAALAVLLIGFYLGLPFIRVGGEQLLRIDVPNRHVIFFGQIFWPQDIPYFLLLFLLFLIGTVTLVALLGRVFCGWLCPHNVFLEMVYRPLERLFEGKAIRRRRQDQQPGGGIRARKVAKWLAYVIVSGALANTAAAVFVGVEAFRWGLIVDPINHPSAAIFFLVFFSACLFNFAWFREQTCTIVCPYGRLQSALLDTESMVVAYDHPRGEPRGKPGKVDGDCIDCHRCVHVCPTGIDIRNGNQLECIHCAACIDACNDVMRRLDRAPNLIKYTSENSLEGKPRRIIRPRTIIYLLVLLGLSTLTATLLLGRRDLHVILLRGGTQSRLVHDGTVVRRGYRLSLINRSIDRHQVSISLPEGLPHDMAGQHQVTLEPNTRIAPLIYIDVPVEAIRDTQLETELVLSYGAGSRERVTVPITITRPAQGQDRRDDGNNAGTDDQTD